MGALHEFWGSVHPGTGKRCHTRDSRTGRSDGAAPCSGIEDSNWTESVFIIYSLRSLKAKSARAAVVKLDEKLA